MGQTWRGFGTTGLIPDAYLARGLDNLGQIAYITRGYTKFLHMLHKRFPKSKMVDTREPRTNEFREMDRTLTVTVESSDTNHTQFGLSNQQAAQIQENDILFHKGLYVHIERVPLISGQVLTNNTLPSPAYDPLQLNYGFHVTGVAYSRTFGPDNYAAPTQWFQDHEQVIVRNVGTPDSAGTGNTLITVERCFRGAGGVYDLGASRIPISIVNAGVTAGTPDAGKILVNDVWLRGLPSWAEGSGSANGYHKNPELGMNCTQEFKYAVEITKESKIERHWMGESHMTLNKWLLTRQIALDTERTFLLGQKGKSMDRAGRVQYTMDGLCTLPPKDKQHYFKHPNTTMTYVTLFDLFEQAWYLGGSEERDLYVGITGYNLIKKSFYNSSYLRYNEQASAHFELPIETLYTSGGIINLIPCFTLEEAGWGTRGLLMDTSVPFAVPLTHDGWDMRVDDIGFKGEQIEKQEIIGIKGLELQYGDYQCIIELNGA